MKMRQSIFSYNLTRPFPYPWFTWVVVLGGLVATALLTVLNIAANGYEPSYIYKSNLNDTEHPNVTIWYEKMPWSLASKVKSSCQDQTLQTGSKIRTTSGLAQYEIMAIKPADARFNRPLASFAYHGEKLQDCEISRIYVDANPTNLKVQAMVDCFIVHDETKITISLKVRGTGDTDNSGVPTTSNAEALSSLGLILRMLTVSLVYQNVSRQTSFQLYWYTLPAWPGIGSESPVAAQVVQNTTMALTPAISRMGDLDLKFLSEDQDLSAWLVEQDQVSAVEQINLESWSYLFGADLSNVYATQGDFASRNSNASATVLMDYVAKLFRSYVLGDLGRTSGNNIFSNTTLLWESSKLMFDWFPAFRQAYEHLYKQPWSYSFNETTRNDPESLLRYLGRGKPRVQEAAIETLYLCQIPKRKPALSLIITVLVADFVLLSAMWTVFCWMAKMLLERQDTGTNLCVGCAKAIDNHDNLEVYDRNGSSPYFEASLDLHHGKNGRSSQGAWSGWLGPLRRVIDRAQIKHPEDSQLTTDLELSPPDFHFHNKTAA